MSIDYAKPLLEILKLAPRYLVSLAIVCAFFLFGSEKWLKWLGVCNFTQNYRTILAVLFVFTGVLFVVDRSIAVLGWTQRTITKTKFKKAGLQRLHSLTEDEKQILRFYIVKQTRSNILRDDDGIVQGLIATGIIFRPAGFGNLVEGFAHNITQFAWEYLNKHPELLDGTTTTYRTDRLLFR